MAVLEPKYEQYHRVYNTEHRVAVLNLNMNSITEYTIKNIELLDLNLNMNSITEHTIQNIEWLGLNLNMNSITYYRT